MLTLETERLSLRNWVDSDVGSYMLLSKDVGYSCFSPPGHFLVHTPEEAKEKIQGTRGKLPRRFCGTASAS